MSNNKYLNKRNILTKLIFILMLLLTIICVPIPVKAKEKKIKEKDIRLMSSIIYAEAGNQCYAGQLAVGIVIKNRIENKAFPNTLKKVIYQKNQFGPVRNGSLKKALKLYDKNKIPSRTIKAAKNALKGEKKVKYKGKYINMKKYYYFNTNVKNCKIKIQNHEFK